MKLSDFDYILPAECIAQHPIATRDHSRLMVLDRATGRLDHRHFYDLHEFLNRGDTLVFNDSRVIPARLKGTINGSGQNAEILLLKQLDSGRWQALVRPGRKLMPGAVIWLTKGKTATSATIVDRQEGGLRTVLFSNPEVLNAVGETPLPPYIKTRLCDSERYQTIYAKRRGSAAAPTAGLHFTEALLEKIKAKGVNLAFVTLHIGLDTFQPVRAEDPSHHRIHSEFGSIDPEAADLIGSTRKRGGRVIAVGTTSVRLVESASISGQILPFSGQTGLFILPGYTFKTVDALLTNFHLPRSTLLMMVSAFAGREMILECYEAAKAGGYRFFSFGDAMLIL